jgi:flagellar motor switch protein FliN/FliY
MADALDPDEIDALIAQQAAEAAGDVTDAELVADDAADDTPFSADDIAELIAQESRGAGETPRPPVLHEPLIEEVSFAELPPVHAPIDQHADIDLLLDVPLQITVELGQAKRTIRELLELGQGSILHLTRHAGEPVDVLVNGQHIARGEVVVIDENFGIRVTEVVSPADRLRTMAA